jgi:hypothetical protein
MCVQPATPRAKDQNANSFIFAMQQEFVTNHIAFVAIPGSRRTQKQHLKYNHH